MLTTYDYIVLAFYLAFMLAVSWAFRRYIQNASDYFRGGGKVLWWIAGGSAFMVSFSAWTFTGAAGKAYADGWPISVIFFANSLAFLLSSFLVAPRLRQLRVVTSVQAIRDRFGPATEQVFTWVQLPVGTIQAGIWLNALGVFFAAAFKMDLNTTIIVVGLVVVLIAVVGGMWGVVASDFIQVLILMPVCLVVTVFALMKVGGVHAFADRIPATHLDLSQIFRKEFLLFWCVAMFVKQFTTTNNLMEASRYLCVKDSQHARKAARLGSLLFLVAPLLWFVPPMACRILHPDTHGLLAFGPKVGDASFMIVAADVLPTGMLGLLISGVFAATMSSVDCGLNRNAGIFVKNFYQPILHPGASEARLLFVGKGCTLLMGGLMITTAIWLGRLTHISLFSMTVRFSALVTVPIAVPLVCALFIKHVPSWAGWSTLLVCFAGSLLVETFLPPAWAASFFHYASLGRDSAEYWQQAAATAVNIMIGVAWFLGTKLFWRKCPDGYKRRSREFFAQLNRPIDFAQEIGNENDAGQKKIVGRLCLVYGIFISLFAVIPNPVLGRIAFLFCGGVALLFAALLLPRRKPPRRRGAVIRELAVDATVPKPLVAQADLGATQARIADSRAP